MLNSFRKLGRSCITFRDLGSTVKIVLGCTRKYRRGAREILALFSGSEEAHTPRSPLPLPREGSHIRDLSVGIEI